MMPPAAAQTSDEDAIAGSYPRRSNSWPDAQPAARNASARKIPKTWIGIGPTCRMSGTIEKRGILADGIRARYSHDMIVRRGPALWHAPGDRALRPTVRAVA